MFSVVPAWVDACYAGIVVHAAQVDCFFSFHTLTLKFPFLFFLIAYEFQDVILKNGIADPYIWVDGTNWIHLEIG